MFKFLPAFFATIGLVQATSLTADSPAGRRLMEKAFVVEPSQYARSLADNNENNNGYYTNLSSMTIKYVGCTSYSQYGNGNQDRNQYWYQQEGGQEGYQNAQYQAEQYAQNQNGQQNGDGQNQWWEYQQQARNDGLEMANLVRFTLCPASDCGGQCSGEYVIGMEIFVEEYLDWKMGYENFWCERVRENCVCNNNYSWQECYASCFEQKGLSYDSCMTNSNNNNNKNNGNNVFQIQQYLECTGIKFYNPDYMYRNNYYGAYNSNSGNSAANGNGNNFSWQNYYYLGLTCDSNNVALKAFYDEDCSFKADESAVADAMGDYTNIPYLKGTPVLAKDTCLPCIDAEDQSNQQQQNQYSSYNNANGNYWEDNWQRQPDATSLCQMVTNSNGKSSAIVCDQYNQMGCNWIENTLPSLNGSFSFDYAAQYAKLMDQITRSERLQWTFLGLVLALVGALAVTCGYFCSGGQGRRLPPNRAALLEYRREDGKLSALSAAESQGEMA